VERYVQRGYPEPEARNLAEEKVRQEQELSSVRDMKYDMEIRDLTKDTFFADADTFKSELKEKMKSLNIGAEEAYMMVRGRARAQEIKLETEQRAAVKKKTKKPAGAKPSPVTSPYKLDEHDKKALAELQKAQPETGWTVEKYHKLMKE